MKFDKIAQDCGVDVDSIRNFRGEWLKDLQDLLLVEKAVNHTIMEVLTSIKESYPEDWLETHNPLQVVYLTRVVCDRFGLDWKEYV